MRWVHARLALISIQHALSARQLAGTSCRPRVHPIPLFPDIRISEQMFTVRAEVEQRHIGRQSPRLILVYHRPDRQLHSHVFRAADLLVAVAFGTLDRRRPGQSRVSLEISRLSCLLSVSDEHHSPSSRARLTVLSSADRSGTPRRRRRAASLLRSPSRGNSGTSTGGFLNYCRTTGLALGYTLLARVKGRGLGGERTHFGVEEVIAYTSAWVSLPKGIAAYHSPQKRKVGALADIFAAAARDERV
jgi:hypothetical protein